MAKDHLTFFTSLAVVFLFTMLFCTSAAALWIQSACCLTWQVFFERMSSCLFSSCSIFDENFFLTRLLHHGCFLLDYFAFFVVGSPCCCCLLCCWRARAAAAVLPAMLRSCVQMALLSARRRPCGARARRAACSGCALVLVAIV